MRLETHADLDEEGAPTPERARIANGALQKFDLYEKNGRTPIATLYRVATPIFKMYQGGQISESEQKAAEFFYRDYTIGMMASGLTMKYGERMGSGGTPLNQQANSDRLSPDERRAFHHTRYVKACTHVSHKATAYWLTALACEIPLGEPAKVPTLSDIGRSVMGYTCRNRSQAAGATIVKFGLEKLADFYGLDK